MPLTTERAQESEEGESKMQRGREGGRKRERGPRGGGGGWEGVTCDSGAQPRGGSRRHKTETAHHRWVEKPLGGAPPPVNIGLF